MARFLKHKKETIGLSPDAIKFRGDKKIDFVKIRVIDYDEDNLTEEEITNIPDTKKFDQTESCTWLNIDGLHDEILMTNVSESFEIDPLIISEVLNTHGRPKIHEYDNCIFITLKMMNYNEDENLITVENLSLIIKENILISFQEKVGDVFEPVRNRIRKSRKLIRKAGPDYLAFALIDIVIDNYISILSRIGEKIESIEDRIINDTSVEILEEINEYKSEINYIRKTVKPVRELIQIFVKTESEFIEDDVFIHIKELQDNINLANDSVESYRELLLEQINVYQTRVSNKLNDIMKTLTIFSVIFIPLTFLAGIYGMNFEFMPELKYQYSYPILISIMVLVAVIMIIYMRIKKWF
jgi:magnesium transporter